MTGSSTPDLASGQFPRFRSIEQWWREDGSAPAITTAGVLLIGYVLMRSLWWGSEHSLTAAASIYYLPVYLLAALVSWLTSRRHELSHDSRRAWVLFAGGALAIFVNDFANYYYEFLRPSAGSRVWTDLVAMSAYPLWIAGIRSISVKQRSEEEQAKFWLDLATVSVGATLLTWYAILRPTALAVGSPVSERLLAAIFPVADLVLLIAAASIVAQAPIDTSRRALQIFLGGVVAQFTGDLWYGRMRLMNTYHSGAVIDTLWLGAGLAFAAAAAVQYRVVSLGPRSGIVERDRRLDAGLMPYISVAAAGCLVLVAALPMWREPVAQVALGTLIITTLVVMRQVIANQDNARLVRARIRQDARFRSLVQNASDLVTVVDAEYRISYQSPSITRALGHTPKELEGGRLLDLVHPDDIGTVQMFLHRTVAVRGQTLAAANWRMRHQDGSWRTVESIGMNLLLDPSVRGIVLNTRDVTDRVALEAELAHQAFHDPLTGLANRALLRDRAEHAMVRARRQGQTAQALLFLDLDNFKVVNDSLGHTVGDEILVHAARRLVASVRATDTVARIGGDEFAVFVEEAATDVGCVQVAERILAAFAVPLRIGERDVFIGASIGIAAARDGDNAEGLLRNADIAMCLAKSRGKGRIEWFAPEMHVTAIDRVELESDLRRAIEHGGLVLHYQPIVMLETGSITGVEALVRWQHPTRGLLAPAQFIPLAEETGMIVPLGAWVLKVACHQAQLWGKRRTGTPLAMAVNVSGLQIDSTGFVDDVRSALAESGLEPHALILELTESVLTLQTPAVQQTLQTLKEIGVRLAIDDFGTGYSSLSYLQRFPIDILKIAKPFVDDVAEGAENGSKNRPALAQAVISLGATLEVRTIAEGIEMPQQLERLIELGCDLGQGYHFSRPVPAAELEGMLFDMTTSLGGFASSRHGRRVGVGEPL